MRPATVPAALLIEDLDFYPRATIDGGHVTSIVQSLDAGVVLPPITVDRKSKRLVDGWHRRRAVLRAYGPDAEIEVFYKTYKSDREMYEDAVRLNSAHGRKLTPYDHARIRIRATELHIPTTQVAVILHRTPEYVEQKLVTAIRHGNGGEVALKRPLRRFRDEKLTVAQEFANEHSSGWGAGFHANQLTMLLEADAVDLNEDLLETFGRLRDLLDGLI